MRTEAVTEAIQQVAEAEILPRFRALAAHEVIEKRPGDLVTVADRLAEKALADVFNAATPGCLVIGEEGIYADPSTLSSLPEAEQAWVIDPVDGTRNFARGRADFAVMVAEVRRGVTTRGWIWQPLHDRMYVAELGAGVTCNGDPVPPAARERPVVGAFNNRYLSAFGRLPDDVRLVRLAGCCGVDYPDLVEGRRDFLGYWSMHPWDHLPGGLMVAETGGVLATIDGRPYTAAVKGRFLIAAADQAAWDRAAGLVRAQFQR